MGKLYNFLKAATKHVNTAVTIAAGDTTTKKVGAAIAGYGISRMVITAANGDVIGSVMVHGPKVLVGGALRFHHQLDKVLPGMGALMIKGAQWVFLKKEETIASGRPSPAPEMSLPVTVFAELTDTKEKFDLLEDNIKKAVLQEWTEQAINGVEHPDWIEEKVAKANATN